MGLRKVIPIGMNGNLLELFDDLKASYQIPAVLDDAPQFQRKQFEGIPILPISCMSDDASASFLCMIGSPRSFPSRAGIVGRIGAQPQGYVTFVHPDASVSHRARIGHGTALYGGVLVTSNGEIGNHVLILPRTICHHDTVIGDFSIIGAGVILAGGVRIGRGCYVASGSVIRDGTTVGDGAMIGMGSVVVRDVAPGAVVAGNPARPLKSRDRVT